MVQQSGLSSPDKTVTGSFCMEVDQLLRLMGFCLGRSIVEPSVML
jgi:hypothetical protein